MPEGRSRATTSRSPNLDTAIAVADREGLRHPMTVALPDGDRGTFSAIGYAFDQPSDERTVHVDRYGGKVRGTYGYDDYPLLAKVVSQGIGLHEGRSLGLANMVASAAFCLAVIALCVTGPLMWWRRRPHGRGWALPEGGCRSPGRPFSRSVWWVSGCSSRCSGSACSSYCCWTGSCSGGSPR